MVIHESNNEMYYDHSVFLIEEAELAGGDTSTEVPATSNSAQVLKVVQNALLSSGFVKNSPSNARFSITKPVERVRYLVAVHNLKPADLANAADLGGFPAPSIAVVKDTMGHGQYGPISLLFHSGTIDPRASKDNHIFGRDAWTPTFPEIVNHVDKYKAIDVGEEIYGQVEKNGLHNLLVLQSKYGISEGVADALETGEPDVAGLMERDLGRSAVWKAAYLIEKGGFV